MANLFCVPDFSCCMAGVEVPLEVLLAPSTSILISAMHSVSSKLYRNLKIRVLNSRDHKLGFKLLGQTLSLLSQTGLRFETENTDLSYTWHVIMFEQQEMSRVAKVRHEKVTMQWIYDYSVLKLKQNECPHEIL